GGGVRRGRGPEHLPGTRARPVEALPAHRRRGHLARDAVGPARSLAAPSAPRAPRAHVAAGEGRSRRVVVVARPSNPSGRARSRSRRTPIMNIMASYEIERGSPSG